MSSEHHDVPSVSDDSRESKATVQSGPHVGLFYVVDGKLYWEGIPVAQASGTPYFKSYPKKHSDYWKAGLVPRMPMYRRYGPDHFPRGRVVLDVKKNRNNSLSKELTRTRYPGTN